jgi:hypothetical protein
VSAVRSVQPVDSRAVAAASARTLAQRPHRRLPDQLAQLAPRATFERRRQRIHEAAVAVDRFRIDGELNQQAHDLPELLRRQGQQGLCGELALGFEHGAAEGSLAFGHVGVRGLARRAECLGQGLAGLGHDGAQLLE